jgi:diaminopimelate dehydrogenase
VKRTRLAIVGFGRVGDACAALIHEADDVALAGIVRRPESTGRPLPDRFRSIPVVSRIEQIQDVHAALICVPTAVASEAAHAALQRRIATIDCATLHGQALDAHRDTVHRAALRHGVPAVVAAGADPGALSLFRALFALLVPGGATRLKYRTAVHLHHTEMTDRIPGIKGALSTELRIPEGTVQRYVYVELLPGTDPERVAQALRADPLFLGAETFVFPVDDLGSLEDEGRGVVLERRAGPGRLGHQQFLLEARFDEDILTARMMLLAARALPVLEPGAYSLLDVPLNALWGDQRAKAGRECL